MISVKTVKFAPIIAHRMQYFMKKKQCEERKNGMLILINAYHFLTKQPGVGFV